jgi:lysozyme family protein
MTAFKCLSPAHVRTRYAPNGTGIFTGLSWELRYFKHALDALVRTRYAGVVGWEIEFEIFLPKSMCIPCTHQVITLS